MHELHHGFFRGLFQENLFQLVKNAPVGVLLEPSARKKITIMNTEM